MSNCLIWCILKWGQTTVNSSSLAVTENRNVVIYKIERKLTFIRVIKRKLNPNCISF